MLREISNKQKILQPFFHVHGNKEYEITSTAFYSFSMPHVFVCIVNILKLTLSQMGFEALFTIWKGGQLSVPVRTTFAKVETILGANYTPAIPSSAMYATRCQTLICNNKAKSIVTDKHYMLSMVGSTSFSMKKTSSHCRI
jgi:hypothetical protein